MADTATDSQATEPNESDDEEEYEDAEDEDDALEEEQVDTYPHSSDGERTCESENSYLARVRECRRLVHQRLIELGLVLRNCTGGGMLSRHEEESSTSATNTPVATNQTTPTRNPSKRKSPRLTQTCTESTNVPVRSTRCSPRLAAMNLRSPVHYDLAESEEDEEYEDETEELVALPVAVNPPAKKRLWNADIARDNVQKGKARIQRDVDEYGALKVLHPTKL